MSTERTYHRICNVDDIPLDTGVCALVGGRQVAVYRVGEGKSLYAMDNFDPFSQANVLSRGIVGCSGGVPKVASPIYKQQFSLETGECLDNPGVAVNIYPVVEQGGEVFVAA